MFALEFYDSTVQDGDPIAFQYVHQVPQKGDYVSLYLEYKKGYRYYRVKFVHYHFDCIDRAVTDTTHAVVVSLEPIFESEMV